jgi:hypothetical protein
MGVWLSVVAVVLGVGFTAAGAMKVSQPKEKLVASGMAWADDFRSDTLKLIGATEILGGLGVILPVATGVVPVLGGAAAGGLSLVMLGAAVVHVRRREPMMILVNLILLAMAIFVAWGQFASHSRIA